MLHANLIITMNASWDSHCKSESNANTNILIELLLNYLFWQITYYINRNTLYSKIIKIGDKLFFSILFMRSAWSVAEFLVSFFSLY